MSTELGSSEALTYKGVYEHVIDVQYITVLTSNLHALHKHYNTGWTQHQIKE